MQPVEPYQVDQGGQQRRQAGKLVAQAGGDAEQAAAAEQRDGADMEAVSRIKGSPATTCGGATVACSGLIHHHGLARAWM